MSINIKIFTKQMIKNYIVGFAMFLIFMIFVLSSPNFFTLGNLFDIVKQGGILSLVALAMTMVLIVGGMDMSVGARADFSTNICAGMLAAGQSLFLSISLSIILSVGWGLLNAFAVVFLGIPSFIATVGTMFLVTGITFAYNQGQSILLRDQNTFFAIAQGSIGSVPNMVIIIGVITGIIYYFIRRFRLGSYLYAVGNNKLAAKAAGITIWIPQAVAYCLSGLLSGIAGVLGASYISGSFALGSSFEFLITAFAAAFLGSTLIRQGELNPLGTVVAALFISSLNNALTLYGTSHLILPAIEGSILIIALIIGNFGKREIGQMTIF